MRGAPNLNINMAVSRFFCHVCLKDYHFGSRYERHVRSARHRRIEEVLANHSEASEPTFSQQSSSVDVTEAADPGNICDSPDSDPDSNLRFESGEGGSPELICTEESSFVEDELDISELESMFSVTTKEDFSPFDSKAAALAYMLINSPRPMGEANLTFIFYVMRQLDTSLPSLSALKRLSLPGLSTPQLHYSSKGVPFYVNSISMIIKRCVGNPYIASSLARYPTVPDVSIREIFFGRRWREDPRYHAPMVYLPCGSVFIHDFVNFSFEGNIAIGRISQFFYKEGIPGLLAKICRLHHRSCGSYVINDEIIIPVEDIHTCVSAPKVIAQEIDSSTLSPLTPEEYSKYTSSHRLKSIARDYPVIMVPLILYSDDTSGNRSKQWNKFDSWCVKLAGLPNEENQKLDNIHHICSSNKVDSIELAAPMVEELKSLETNGLVAYDSFSSRDVLVVAPVLFHLRQPTCFGDNQQYGTWMQNVLQDIVVHTIRKILQANRDGNPGVIAEPRSKRQTLDVMDRINSQKTQRDKSKVKTQYGIKDSQNPLLQLSIDLHRCTPVETLHTILLGPYKYLLRSLISRLTTAQKDEIQARLASFDFSGLDYKLSYNLTRHYKSFVGRDFKALAQIALYLLTPYMTSGEKKVWLSLSSVFRIAYCQPFLESSYIECKKTCEEFVRTAYEHFPEFKKKVKIHLILHLPEHMIDFGPTSAFNTERCETFNSLIRAKNVFGNRMAPSRDIAQQFSIIEHLRFICSGGSFNGSTRCGEGLVSLFSSVPVQSFLNGITLSSLQAHKSIYQPGALRKVSSNPVTLSSLGVKVKGSGEKKVQQMIGDPKYTLLLMSLPTDILINPATAVIGSSKRELIHVGNSVQFSAGPNEVDIAVLAACFIVPGERSRQLSSYCIIQLYQPMDSFGTPLSNEFNCPLYVLTDLFRCVSSHCISHTVSVLHECSSSCVFKGLPVESQVEREAVISQTLVFHHDFSTNLYSFNLYCMHS